MNGVKKSNQRCFYFSSCCIFPISIVLTLRLTWKGFDVAYGHHEQRSKVNGGLNSLREPVLASPVHSVTFLHISGCDHLCLFSLIFFFSFIHFVLQASANCTVLESEFRQDVQLRSLMKNDINDKIKNG